MPKLDFGSWLAGGSRASIGLFQQTGVWFLIGRTVFAIPHELPGVVCVARGRSGCCRVESPIRSRCGCRCVVVGVGWGSGAGGRSEILHCLMPKRLVPCRPLWVSGCRTFLPPSDGRALMFQPIPPSNRRALMFRPVRRGGSTGWTGVRGACRAMLFCPRAGFAVVRPDCPSSVRELGVRPVENGLHSWGFF